MDSDLDFPDLKYDGTYREEAELKDGTRIVLRMIRPTDKDRLRQGFERLSPRSRYLRFFTSKKSLTEKELQRLCDVDGIDHVAIGAAALVDGEEKDGLGIARFYRLKSEPEIAEPAIAVVDEVQGLGLGTILLQRIIMAARERGIQRFRSEVLAENEEMKSMLAEMSSAAWFVQPDEHGITVIDIPLPSKWRGKNLDPDSSGAFLKELLSHVAHENLFVRLGEELLDFLSGKDP